ncbi:MAG: hypothetical protein ACI9YM_001321 [Brevundimonas sp.]|jgi:hypothetical protein|uniref:hypothetical protein n=1 Tax=Brevundimonas sp. TaxID=1871086 RepID=UPI0039E291E6
MMSVGALFSWSAVAIASLAAAMWFVRNMIARRTELLGADGTEVRAIIFSHSPGAAKDQFRFFCGGFLKLADSRITALVSGYWLLFVARLAAFLSLLTSAALWYVSASQ